jgi:hypothetical protein
MRLAVTLSVAIGLMVAGCGGSAGNQTAASDDGGETETASAGAAAIDPCGLISAEEMSVITTDKVTSTSRDDQTCTYHSNPDDGVQLTVMASGGAKQMQVVHRTAEVLGGMGASVADKGGAGADVAVLTKKDKTAVPKLGDEAAWGMNTTLSVRKGDAFVEVVPPLMHDPATHSGYPLVGKEEKRAIAQKVVERVLAKLP